MNNIDAFNSEQMFEPEDLHEDLVQYIYESEVLGKLLKHPLVFSVPYSEHLNKMLNLEYKAKLEGLKKAAKSKKWSRYVFLHEKPYRLQAFNDIHMFLDNEDYWSILGEIFINSENIFEYFYEWCDFLSSERNKKEFLMEKEDREFFNNLPNEITVYRGLNHTNKTDCTLEGLSWTLDKDKAIWFAKRLAKPNACCVVSKATVHKRDILAYFSTRGESEIVFIPSISPSFRRLSIEPVE